MASETPPAQSTRQVWVAVRHFAPESIPRKPKIAHVFATEESAKTWRSADASPNWGGYREIIPMEVER